ncbi:hypothetical protein THASP1DRAFT_31291 [Thamnocephalis sphaerospora]|uniref:Reverse transcriptase domain-containing protein n=1 Tax=Thamnocephalis sphaerospora TaxID=78915 RepID=A0A4P9XLY8_9FUNG|nr:hypothetical protein THASP1DRAFT_31291 [Thamnocephalis sphaerospora]|eukprot:RKP06903.1 hypothetical protein THASP1DRAFT_31291 [Thamnocephalis sphaerospora]
MPPLRLAGQELQTTDTIIYLGVPVSTAGINTDEWARRAKRRAKAAAANLRRLGLHRRGLKWQQGVFLYKIFVRPCMEYGLALIPPTKTLLAELDLIQISVLRKVTRSYASTSHGVLLRLAGCTDMCK